MKFWIDEHGCAKNQVDAEEITARLESDGHSFVNNVDEADLIIVNSCGFIDSAKEESINSVIKLKKEHPSKKILLSGCLSQRFSKELEADLVEADGIMGNADLSITKIAALETLNGKRKVFLPERKYVQTDFIKRTRLFDYPGTAHVKIAEGCNHSCSFCAIPGIRGKQLSREPNDIVEECRELIKSGIKEIVFIGQDLGSYGKDTIYRSNNNLISLLKEVLKIKDDFWLRILYIHPDHFPKDLIRMMLADKRLLPYFDLPFQHASKNTLKTMNRFGDKEKYLELIQSIRSELPESIIRSTFLLGHPGETEEDFDLLLDFQEQAKIDWLGTFIFSKEIHTLSYNMPDQVSHRIAKSRKEIIEARQVKITSNNLTQYLKKEFNVLIEENIVTQEEVFSLGRSWIQAPDVDGLVVIKGKFKPGSIIRARAEAIRGFDMEARAIE